ncbi:MAG TPA: fimbrial biogenesis outer membrane usher protein, partial [Cupriavidus sp.]|nr:fimbrial biogenesis outer membrane usher protein [Cupriavidus sp.]
TGLRIDRWGHAVVSNLTPFSRNEINLDPKGLPLNVELKSTMQNVAPTAGAVVKVLFETDNPGRAVALRIKLPDGSPLPFGAEVLDDTGRSFGTVAQGGLAILRGVKDDSGTLLAKWGAGPKDSCSLSYALPGADATPAGLVQAGAECRPNP